MRILLQILSILIALVAIMVSWQIVRNTHRIAFHGESAWRKALFETIDNPRWTASDLEKIRNRMNLKILAFYEHRCFGIDDSQQPSFKKLRHELDRFAELDKGEKSMDLRIIFEMDRIKSSIMMKSSKMAAITRQMTEARLFKSQHWFCLIKLKMLSSAISLKQPKEEE